MSRVTFLSLIVLASAVCCRAVTADNPYQAIVGRNVFSLKPPPPPLPPEDPLKKNPPPTIKLQGIQTILDRRQVLFLVQAKPPGQPKEESFVMSEGERQGEIEVLQIDDKAGTVKFNNHGQPQLLNMKDDTAKPAMAATPLPGALPPGVPPGTLPGIPAPAAAMNPSAAGTITTFGGRAPAIPQRPLRAPTTGGMPAGATVVPQTTQVASPFTHEEQQVLIEAKRKYYQETGDARAKVMPPTLLMPPKESPTSP